MSMLTPGKVITTFTTKKGRQAVIRYPKWEDLDGMLTFINAVSQEDIYVTFSGEMVTREGEIYFLSEMMKGMEMQNTLFLACFVEGKYAGSCSILRDMQGRRRSAHVGIFGITIGKEFRGEGIGEAIATATIQEAIHAIPELKVLRLQMYSPNTVARNLYEKLGFEEYGRLPNGIWYRGSYVDEILMQKKLE